MEGTPTDLWVKWKCSDELPSLCCVDQLLCTWGAGTGNGTDQIQAVEEEFWWHFLHPQLLKNSFTILESGQPSSSLWSRKKTGHSLSLTRYSGEEKMAAWMSLSTGRKPMHMDQYIHSESHHRREERCGEMSPTTGSERSSACRTTFRRKLTTLLESSGYPANYICNASAPPT